MLALLPVLALAATPPDWRELEARETPMGRVAISWDAASVDRRGARVRVTLREPYLLSGLPDGVYTWRVEIDCVRRTARERGRHVWRRRNALTPRYARLAESLCPG